jgi:hypothetical protein
VVDEVLIALEGSELARTMRSSTFLFPLANVLHVLGAMVFFAAVAAMDVRAFRSRSLDEFRAFIRRVRPKIAAILLGLLNVALLEAAARGARPGPSGTLRVSAALSAVLWLSTAAAGRLIAYF